MSENLDLVRSIYADWERGVFGRADWAHPEIEYVVPDGPEPGTWTGIAAMADAFNDQLRAWEHFRVEATEFRELDDKRVLALVQFHARGKSSAVAADQEGAEVFDVRDCRVTRLVAYWERKRALADLGLKELAVSQENVEIVRRLYESWAREEFPGPAELLDPDIEYVNPHGAIEPGIRRGLPAFKAAIDKLFEGWSTWTMEPEQFRAVGDQVAVVVHYCATARTSGLEVEGRESALLTVRDGMIARYEWFHGPDDALKAVGLEE